ncbi:resolvase [Macrococcoides goetzii]|uniref:Resolvase n=1 Tax=Macrococcoides goetzii TaxID=1891097 RepID=A0A364JMD6_9STAP|nr:recombinase family protein [Macrococcus goetzii]RAI82119.1 resolvase [Macrococcus goetzii]
MKYGYIRPIELNDSKEKQIQKLLDQTDHLLCEEHAKNKKREVLENLLNHQLKPNDEIIVTDLFILADSTKHLMDIVNTLQEKDASLNVYNLSLVITPETELSFIKSLELITQFQSDVVRFRTKLGIEKSREEGKQIGRPKRTDDNLNKAIDMYLSKKYTLDEIKEKTNISRATLYRHIDK